LKAAERSVNQQQAAQLGGKQKSIAQTASAQTPKQQPPAQTNKTKASGKIEKSTARDARIIEIADAEKRLAALSQELSSTEAARVPATLARLNADYSQTDERLRELYEEWERHAATETTSA
jgi:ABC-type phosphate transport system auxiliary subunit